MDISEVRTHAKELKETIEAALKKFRDTTGNMPKVEVENQIKRTNTADFSTQKVTITIVL